jgi:hypothetical protein
MTGTLPNPASDKLAEFRDAEMDARDIVRSCANRINELNHAIGMNPESDNVPNYEREISRLSVKQMEQETRYREFATLNAKLTDFVRIASVSGEIEQARPVVPKTQRGESVKQAVDRIRTEIAALQKEKRKVEAASPPVADLKAAARAHVEAIAEQGKPRLTATHDEFKFTWVGDWGPRLKFEAIFAWLFPDSLLAKLYAEIESQPKTGLALSAAEKKERLASLASQIAAAEQQEEALIMAACDQGQEIMRRADVANLAAILGIVVKKRGTVAA